MNIDRLIKALEAYDDHSHPEGRCTCGDLAEVKALKAKMEETGCYSIWEGAINVIATNDLCDIQNVYLYDKYGYARKIKGEPLTMNEYKQAIKTEYCFENFTDDMLQSGIDVIEDLWVENEADEEHNPNGTFNNRNVTLDATHAVEALRLVDAFIMTNHETLEEDELHNCKVCADALGKAVNQVPEYIEALK